MLHRNLVPRKTLGRLELGPVRLGAGQRHTNCVHCMSSQATRGTMGTLNRSMVVFGMSFWVARFCTVAADEGACGEPAYGIQ